MPRGIMLFQTCEKYHIFEFAGAQIVIRNYPNFERHHINNSNTAVTIYDQLFLNYNQLLQNPVHKLKTTVTKPPKPLNYECEKSLNITLIRSKPGITDTFGTGSSQKLKLLYMQLIKTLVLAGIKELQYLICFAFEILIIESVCVVSRK
ncbi:Hypothetical_protein [Hexamita inflata]|uniref:Hypothetical_protein n=1 Tax=Hexamita inflata TaxID=28002 RepID=A0ABP1HJZ6_9EUKA